MVSFLTEANLKEKLPEVPGRPSLHLVPRRVMESKGRWRDIDHSTHRVVYINDLTSYSSDCHQEFTLLQSGQAHMRQSLPGDVEGLAFGLFPLHTDCQVTKTYK